MMLRSGFGEAGMVLDDLMPAELLDDLRLEFPALPASEIDVSHSDLRQWGRAYRKLDELLASPQLLRRVEELTGVTALCFDREYLAAGLRVSSDGAPPVSLAGRHPCGWYRRLTLAVEVDSGRVLIAPAGAPLTRLAGPGEGARRWVHAYLYSDEPEPEPVVVAPSPLAEPEATEFEPAARPAPARLSGSFGSDPERFVDDHDALMSVIAARSERLAAMLVEEAAYSRALGERAGRLLSDVSAPLRPEEVEAIRWLADRHETLVSALEAAPAEFLTARARVDAMPPLPCSGALQVVSRDGCWRDGWVTHLLELELRTTAPIERLVIGGYVPDELSKRQRLTAVLEGGIHHSSPFEGGFEWSLPCALRAGARLRLQIAALSTWRPKDTTESVDDRRLAWLLSALRAE